MKRGKSNFSASMLFVSFSCNWDNPDIDYPYQKIGKSYSEMPWIEFKTKFKNDKIIICNLKFNQLCLILNKFIKQSNIKIICSNNWFNGLNKIVYYFYSGVEPKNIKTF